MNTIKNQHVPPSGPRSRVYWLALCLAAMTLVAFPPNASAIILMEVQEPLTLFEIEGITFAFYSTSARTRLRVEDTDAGRSGIVDVQGQIEGRSTLTLCAFSREDSRQKVRIAINIAPLRGPATGSFFALDALGAAVEPRSVTDPALAALEGPLTFGFRLERETVNPNTGNRRTIYRLVSVERVHDLTGEWSGNQAQAITSDGDAPKPRAHSLAISPFPSRWSTTPPSQLLVGPR